MGVAGACSRSRPLRIGIDGNRVEEPLREVVNRSPRRGRAGTPGDCRRRSCGPVGVPGIGSAVDDRRPEERVVVAQLFDGRSAEREHARTRLRGRPDRIDRVAAGDEQRVDAARREPRRRLVVWQRLRRDRTRRRCRAPLSTISAVSADPLPVGPTATRRPRSSACSEIAGAGPHDEVDRGEFQHRDAAQFCEGLPAVAEPADVCHVGDVGVREPDVGLSPLKRVDVGHRARAVQQSNSRAGSAAA